MKKLIITFLFFMMSINFASAKHIPYALDKAFEYTVVPKSAVSISIQNINNPKQTYQFNSDMPMIPASTQKLITIIPSLQVLGNDYKFSTKLYKDKTKDEYYIVLGADPYLTSKELKLLLGNINLPKDKNISKIYLDDTIFDKVEWGEGWQWDDDLNPLMPKFSAYNIDKNIMQIVIAPSMNGYPPEVIKEVNYPLTFINNMITSKETKYKIKRQNHISPDILVLEGTIRPDKSEIIKIPINNPKKYFTMRLSDCIINHGISSSGIYNEVKLNKNYQLITLLSHDISDAKTDIYKNSNNFVCETTFKIAGGKYTSKTGSFENGMIMFNDFCKKHDIDTSDIKLTDASGVSKNNLVTTDFMTSFLLKTRGFLEKNLPTAGEGTLTNRMLYLKGFVYAKTGTLYNISAMAGYISTLKRQKYVFSIIINDRCSNGDKKMLEEYILRTIYSKG